VAIIFDAASNGTTTTSPLTISHTVAAGSKRLLVVGIYGRAGTSFSISSVTYNGVALTEAGFSKSGLSYCGLWYLIAPATGTHNVVITFAGVGSPRISAGVVSRIGVDQTTPIGTVAATTLTTGQPTVNVSSATDEVVVDVVGVHADATFTVGANQTSRWVAPTTGTMSAAGSEEPGAATVTMSWTASSTGSFWRIVAMPIKPDASTIILAGTASGDSPDTANLTTPPIVLAGSLDGASPDTAILTRLVPAGWLVSGEAAGGSTTTGTIVIFAFHFGEALGESPDVGNVTILIGTSSGESLGGSPDVASLSITGTIPFSGIDIGETFDIATLVPPPFIYIEPAFGIGRGGVQRVHAHLWRATIDNVLVEDISDLLLNGRVEFSLDRDVAGQANFSIRDASRINPYTDYLAPFIHLSYDDTRGDTGHTQLGLYSLRVPPGEADKLKYTGEIIGDDLTSVLLAAAYTNSTTVAATTVLRTEMIGAILNGGISRTSFPDSTETPSAAFTFPPGTTRLEKVNSISDILGWYRPHATLEGVLSSSGPYVEPADREPIAVWTNEDLIRPIAIQPRDIPPRNIVLVIKDNPSAAPLIGVARNDDPTSPSSTVSTGVDRVRVERVSDLQTQTEVNALARRLLAEERLLYRTARISVWSPPILTAYDAIDLNLTGKISRFSGRWAVRNWGYGFNVSSAFLDVVISQTRNEQGDIL